VGRTSGFQENPSVSPVRMGEFFVTFDARVWTLSNIITCIIAIGYSPTPVWLLFYSWIYGILVLMSYTFAGIAAYARA